MDELFARLGAISDAWLEEQLGRVEGITEAVLAEMTEQDLEDADLMWWVALLTSLFEPVVLQLPLDARARAIQGFYGAPLQTSAFRDKVWARMDGVIQLEAARLHSRAEDARVGDALGEDFVLASAAAVQRAVENVIRETDTAMSMFDRLAFAAAGARAPGARRWAYDGPRDSRNRPFCAAVLDAKQTYDDAGVEALNRHPLLHRYVPPNVKTLCGGFGCRHVFISLSREEAEQRGLKWR